MYDVHVPSSITMTGGHITGRRPWNKTECAAGLLSKFGGSPKTDQNHDVIQVVAGETWATSEIRKKKPAAATNKRQLVFINALTSIQFILTKKYNINEFNHMGLLISHEYRELKDVLNEIKGV